MNHRWYGGALCARRVNPWSSKAGLLIGAESFSRTIISRQDSVVRILWAWMSTAQWLLASEMKAWIIVSLEILLHGTEPILAVVGT